MARSLRGALSLLSALIKLINESRKDVVFAPVLALALWVPRQLASHTRFAPGSAKLYQRWNF